MTKCDGWEIIPSVTHRARVSRLCIHTLRTKYQLIILSENYNTPILTGVTTILANLSNSQFTTILFLVYESRPHRSYTILCLPRERRCDKARSTSERATCALNSCKLSSSHLHPATLLASWSRAGYIYLGYSLARDVDTITICRTTCDIFAQQRSNINCRQE